MADWIQQNFPDIYRIGMQGVNSWPDAIYATLYMTVISFIIGGLLGLVMGLFLVLTGPRGVIENKFVFQILDKITSIFRAIPFIILLAILKGFTYFIVGTNLGMTAALVPLSAATFPFFARQVQVVLADLDRGVIEAAQASGATLWDTIKVYLGEGLPELVRVSTVTLISLVGETAMLVLSVPVVLVTSPSIMDITVLVHQLPFLATFLILILIFLVQFLGDFLTRKLSHK